MPNAHHGWRRGIAVAVASAAVLAGAFGTDAQETVQKAAPEVFTAYAVNTGPAGGPKEAAQPVIIHVIIDRWSTEQERQALVRAFEEKGPNGLLSALQKTARLGTLRASTSLGWDLHYAVQVPEGDGRRIIVGTERRVNYWQASRDTQATDYPFTLVELRLDKDGKGEGRMSIATKITRSKDGKRIELEHYSVEPVRLQDVRRQKN
jgi:hypothetical protein